VLGARGNPAPSGKARLNQILLAIRPENVQPIVGVFRDPLLYVTPTVRMDPPEIDIWSRGKLALDAVQSLPVIDDQIVGR
jgi:hypothetical protein